MLPIHQLRRVPIPIAGQIAESRFTGDERRVNAELVSVRVATLLQFAEAVELRFCRAMKFVPDDFRLLMVRNGESGLDCVNQTFAAAR